MLSERVSEMAEARPRLTPPSTESSGIPIATIPHKFHRPGFPVEYSSIPSPVNQASYPTTPVDRQSYPTSPSSPCSTSSDHDSSLEKQMPTDSDHSDDGEKDSFSKTEYYRNPNSDNNGEFIHFFY